jgi:hypothetical protein
MYFVAAGSGEVRKGWGLWRESLADGELFARTLPLLRRK